MRLQAIRQSGISITEVARRLNKSRRHLYNLFDDPNISLNIVLQIGKIIHHDFTSKITELNIKNEVYKSNLMENHKNVEHWKDKYLSLLEKYNLLLEQQNK
jgi:predicted transcriptional regulator